MKISTQLKFYIGAVAVLFSGVSARAATLVEWGASGGQEMVTKNANGSGIPTTYSTTTYLSPGNGNNGYSTSVVGQTRNYYGASDAQVFGLNNNGGGDGTDAIQMVRNFGGAGGTVKSMIAWETADFLTSVNTLDSFDMEFSERGGTTTAHYLIQTGSGWYRSVEAVVDDGSNNWGGFSKNNSNLTWASFSSFGVTGGSGIADLSDVKSVGAYFTSAADSGKWIGAKLRYFRVTEVSPIVQTNATYTDVSAAAAVTSATDLVNQGEATYAGFTVSDNRSGDGAADDGSNDGATAETFESMTWFKASDGQFPATVTFDLDVSVNIAGYNISEINSIAGWKSGTQADQEVTVEYSMIGDAEFVNLGTFANIAAGDAEYSRIGLTNYWNGDLASGVDALRFTYADPEGVDNGTDRMVLQEIDVIGVPAQLSTNYTYTNISDLQAAVRNTDLANDDATTFSTSTVTANYDGVDDIGFNDGIASMDANGFANMTWFRNSHNQLPAEVVLNLDVNANSNGYNISEINSSAGWSGGSNQADQILTVEYRVIGSAAWTQIGDVAFTHTAAAEGQFSRVQIGKDSAGYLATGVDALRFTYAVTGNNLALQEIDVIGAPVAVPPTLELSSMFSNDMILQREKAVPVWGTSTAGESITVEFDGQTKTTTTAGDGTWTLNLDSMDADAVGQDLKVTAGQDSNTTVVTYSNVLVGEVWVCSGQSNMAFSNAQTEFSAAVEAAPDNPNLRFFKVPKITQETPLERISTVWTESTTGSSGTAKSFGAVAYYFGLKLQDELESSEGAKDVPIGLIHSAKGGTSVEQWLPAGNNYNSTAGGYYNGQIDALIPFAMRGVLWYQGETNVMNDQDAAGYVTKKKALIDGWRALWGETFPFYYVQLAPYNYTGDADGVLPLFWEAQSAILDQVSNTAMAVTSDWVTDRDGNLNLDEIHPRNKQPAGERLALLALDNTYGQNIVSSGPIFKSMVQVSGTLEVTFDSADGLTTSDGQSPDNFEIAGTDGVFVPATATVSGNKVTLSDAGVASPVSVRFAWVETAQPNLRNAAGLVPSAFRLIDSDGDGISDTVEGSADTDGDGTADYLDLDSDNDGYSDQFEGSGDADSDGVANYLDLDSDNDGYSDALEGGYDRYDPVVVPTEFTDLVGIVLAERSQINESFINPAYKNDLTLSDAGEIRVTFIKEGASNRNSLGYYTYNESTFAGLSKADVDTDDSKVISVEELNSLPGVEMGWVFPNGSALDSNGGILVEGDSYVIGDGRVHPVGTKLGFFLVAKGWVGDGTILQPYRGGIKPYVMFTTDFLNPEAEQTDTLSTDASHSRQVALLFDSADRNEVIMGFEDVRRRRMSDGSVGGDQDFNDAVFSVSSNPASALATSGIATADPEGTDADGDGVSDVNELAGDTDGDGTQDINDPDDDGDGIVTATEGAIDSDSDGTANYLDTDSDNDGIDDSVEGSVDADTDGIANYLDTDSDNDGLLDSQEGSLDSDSDGTPDRIDTDDDGDSIATVEEGTSDSDGDGTADYLDTDSDNDGISDGAEVAGDTDGDGTLDRYDTDDDGDGILTIDEGNADSDGDGLGNHLDLDSDNDGFSDQTEGQVDSDGDGLANRIDSDDDNDGVPSANESSADTDNDGLADYLDTDSDGDGVNDGASIKDVVLTATTRALQANYSGKPLIGGDQIEYTITITNTGADQATTVELDGLVPAETTYVDGTLTVNGSSIAVALDSSTTVDIGTLASNQSTTVTLIVSVNASLSAGLNKISSVVSVDCIESTSVAISDNDASGHCGIVDDGLDHVLDSGSDTNDDDPTNLPLMQGTFAESCTLAFEDLQNAGWCDWDMNDIVLAITSYYVVDGSNDIESMVVTYQLLARGAGYESKLNLTLPFSGDAEWQRIYLDLNGDIEANTLGSATDSATIVLWESSKDALPPFTDLQSRWGAPGDERSNGPTRTERFDPTAAGKSAVVNVYFDSAASNPLDTFSESPHDTWAWIPNTQEEIHRLMFNLASSQTVYTGPLYGRSLPFVAKFDIDFVWPHEGHAIWLSHPDYVPFIKSGGTTNLDWADNFNIWRVWHDDEGMTHRQDDLEDVVNHYSDYVEYWSSQP